MSRTIRNIILEHDEDESVREIATYIDRNDKSASPHVYCKLGKYLAFPNVVQRGIDPSALKWMLELFLKNYQQNEDMTKLTQKANSLLATYFPKQEPDWSRAQAASVSNRRR